jgi:hypothetical protein
VGDRKTGQDEPVFRVLRPLRAAAGCGPWPKTYNPTQGGMDYLLAERSILPSSSGKAFGRYHASLRGQRRLECAFCKNTPPHVTILSKSEGNNLHNGVNATYSLPQTGCRSRLCLFPSCQTASHLAVEEDRRLRRATTPRRPSYSRLLGRNGIPFRRATWRA